MPRVFLWSRDQVKTLRKEWVHFGTHWMARKLNMTALQIKSKVDKLKLKLLPKEQRLCAHCQKNKQGPRYAGVLCLVCHLARRKQLRRGNVVFSYSVKGHKKSKRAPREQWVAMALNTARSRSKGRCNLSISYLVSLWDKQEGMCFYTKEPMREPVYGAGRNPYSVSLDRIDSTKGYIKGNVVWCAWICNCAKNNLCVEEFIRLCTLVSANKDSIRSIIRNKEISS